MFDLVCQLIIIMGICGTFLKQMKLIKKLKLENASLKFLIEENNKEKETI